MWHAFRQALLQVRRTRSHSLAVVAIIALCIGSCVAIAGMVRSVLLVDWGYENPARLAILWHARQNSAGVIGVGPGDYVSYQSSLSTVDGIGAVTTRGFNLGNPSTRVTCARMTSELPVVLGAVPSRGHWFSAQDDQSAAGVAVISERLWHSVMRGQGDPIGGNIVLDGIHHRVIGMMPASFAFPPEWSSDPVATE